MMFECLKSDPAVPRKGMPSPRLGEDEFKRRYRAQFQDQGFDGLTSELEKIADVAWRAYADSRKAPRTRKAGAGYADPDYDLALDWIAASEAVKDAQHRHDDKTAPLRVLLINASARSEHTCPGEMSKSYLIAEIARGLFLSQGAVVDLLDLSRVASEYGRNIHPCKACFSTSAALCHWPCSCYPNYALGQTQDWMNEIYPLWVAAHGIMIVTPVNWYQASSPLKLMMDRLVCADGGNPDPSRTHGKDAQAAKRIELEGWDYPRHLAGRLFSVIVHGDTEGITQVRSALSDWLTSMHLVAAGRDAELDRYIGYWRPYATSHAEFESERQLHEEIKLAARTLMAALQAQREGKLAPPEMVSKAPRQK